MWKGKRPPIDDLNASNVISTGGRRGSIGSTGSSESNSTEGDASSANSSINSLPPAPQAKPSDQVVRGRGVVAKIIDESNGLLWWVLRPNHYQSIWFDRKQTFLFGMNLANHDLRETFKSGDPVSFVAVRTPQNSPTNWVAKQVLVTDAGQDKSNSYNRK